MTEDPSNVTQFKPLRDATRTAVSTSAQSQPDTCPAEIANRRTAILLACFRKGDAADPETYSAAVAAILSCYPTQVVYRVTDPRSGLPGTSQWLPTAAEVKAACEREMQPARDLERRRCDRYHTARILAQSSDESAETRKRVVDEMRARFAELGNDPNKPQPFTKSPERLAEEFSSKGPLTFSPLLRRALGITAEAAE